MTAPLESIRWLLRFAEVDLGHHLAESDLRRWRDDAFRFSRSTMPKTKHVMPLSRASGAWLVGVNVIGLTADQIRDALMPLQAHVREAIAALRRPGTVWRLPALPTSLVVERGQVRRVVTSPDGTPEPLFIAATADVLLAHWQAVRTCDAPECPRLFAPDDPREKYCSLECGRQTRWARFAPTRVRNYAAEYERRQQKRLGPKVRVSRRKRS